MCKIAVNLKSGHADVLRLISRRIQGGMTQTQYPVAPVADGVFLPEDLMKAQADGAINRVDIMIGCNEGEGTPPPPPSNALGGRMRVPIFSGTGYILGANS